jgi:hypothetical protein
MNAAAGGLRQKVLDVQTGHIEAEGMRDHVGS